MTGIVKHFSGKNGYGFVTNCNGDYFFMEKDVIGKKCKVGQSVSFMPEKTLRGLRATQVQAL